MSFFGLFFSNFHEQINTSLFKEMYLKKEMYYDGTMKYYNERCPQSHIIIDFSFCCWDVIPYGEGVVLSNLRSWHFIWTKMLL